MEKRKTTSAVSILNRRYIKEDKERQASLDTERENAQVAAMIYNLRVEAGLNQRELAEKVGTTQSAISRLEDADYDGHSLSMLEKVAAALGHRIEISAVPVGASKKDDVHLVFPKFMSYLRREKKLTVDKLAAVLDLDKKTIHDLENDPEVRPAPLVLHKLSKFYDIPQAKLNALAGAIKDIPDQLRMEASRFAAQADSFSSLTKEEKQALDQFMKAMRSEK